MKLEVLRRIRRLAESLKPLQRKFSSKIKDLSVFRSGTRIKSIALIRVPGKYHILRNKSIQT